MLTCVQIQLKGPREIYEQVKQHEAWNLSYVISYVNTEYVIWSHGQHLERGVVKLEVIVADLVVWMDLTWVVVSF